MEEYKDKLAYDVLKKKVSQIKYLGGVIKLIDEMYPKWIVKTYDRYSDEKSMANWAHICKEMKITPKKIIVVDFIYFDQKKYSNILLFADLLSSLGFSVIDKYRIEETKDKGCLKVKTTIKK